MRLKSINVRKNLLTQKTLLTYIMCSLLMCDEDAFHGKETTTELALVSLNVCKAKQST